MVLSTLAFSISILRYNGSRLTSVSLAAIHHMSLFLESPLEEDLSCCKTWHMAAA